MGVVEGARCCVGCRAVHYENGMWRHKGCVNYQAKVVEPAGSSQGPEKAALVGSSRGGSRHGKYRDLEARREYRRVWMANKRRGVRDGDHA